MLLHTIVPLALCQALLTHAEPIPRGQDVPPAALLLRERPNSPSGGYAPAVVDCPSTKPTIRSASSLSSSEKEWLPLRRNATVAPMIDFLTRANIDGFDAKTYINKAATQNLSALPNIAIAVSGGGYRALMNGAGFLEAADNRTTGSTSSGGIGGLLQASTYLAGLSGGGWLVGSLFANNFSTIQTLRDGFQGSSLWKFNSTIFEGPEKDGISILNAASYWSDIHDAVKAKSDAGFPTSITDYWGRALSYQLINAQDGGPAYTFSSIALDDQFKSGNTPFPILVADERAPGDTIISLNATNHEINAFEMGSFDPTTYGFVPTKYIASNFSGGVVPSDGKCVEGYDQSGFIMGTSSSLFNQFLLQNISSFSNVPQFVLEAIESILESMSKEESDIARYMANPFLGWNNNTNPSAHDDELSLVDGGEDLQNIPLTPLIQPDRSVDVIFAVDSSADTDQYWPNGTAVRASYDRSQGTIANGTLFPPVPDENTFINKGLNNRPTFFGCDVSNFTLSGSQKAPPLLVYIPNAPYTAMSNVSTFDPEYSHSQRDDIIKNAYNGATQGNGTLDSAWMTCVGCAIMSRSWARTATTVPSACQDCFKKYCWDGTLDKASNGPYSPNFKISNQTTLDSAGSSVSVDRHAMRMAVAAAGVAGLLLMV